MMRESLTVAFCYMSFLLLFLAACATFTKQFSGILSRVVDRYQIRPSTFTAMAQVFGGLMMLGSTFYLPAGFTLFSFLYALLASAAIAFGVELLRQPPMVEYRPTWFTGEGNPKWKNDKPRLRWSPRVSLSWMCIVVGLMCVCFALRSVRIRTAREAQKEFDAAVTRILELGGTVQQGTISLAGTDVTDADLPILQHFGTLRDLNLGATKITNDGIPHIANLKHLHTLNLSGTEVDDDGIGGLGALRELRRLKLRKTKTTGTGFPINQRRIHVDLSLCPISKEGLVSLARSKFFDLDLAATGIDDEMLATLPTFDTYKLNVQATAVSPAGVQSIVGPNQIQHNRGVISR